MLLANIGVGFASLVSSVELRDWMHGNGWMGDESELEWSYGQFIPALLGLLVFVSVLENVFGKFVAAVHCPFLQPIVNLLICAISR